MGLHGVEPRGFRCFQWIVDKLPRNAKHMNLDSARAGKRAGEQQAAPPENYGTLD